MKLKIISKLSILTLLILLICYGCNEFKRKKVIKNAYQITLIKIKGDSTIKSFDSIEYKYFVMNNPDKLYISKTTYVKNNSYQNDYYLYKENNIFYVGLNLHSDTVFYQKYLTSILNETCIFNLNKICTKKQEILCNYLYGYLKLTELVVKEDSTIEMTYKGADIALETDSSAIYTFDSKGRLVKLQLGTLIFKSNGVMPVKNIEDDFVPPIQNSIDIFCPSPKSKMFYEE